MDDSLEHFGILGMKWGRRRQKFTQTQINRRGSVKRINDSGHSLDFILTQHQSGQRVSNRILDLMAKDPNRTYLSAKKRSAGEDIALKTLGTIGAISVGAFLSKMNRR